MWLKRISRFPLWHGATLGYAEGTNAFDSLQALSTAALYGAFVGAVLYIVGNLIAE